MVLAHTSEHSTIEGTLPGTLPPANTTGGANRFNRIISHPLFHVAILLALVTYCFVRGLKGYFLADDFGQILYVSKAYLSEPERILRNWTGHLMEIPSMAIYRPWFFMSLLIDYAIWRGNATGYLLSNFVCYCTGVVLLYALVRKLTSDWTLWRSSAAAFFAAALFAVNPLHCESVCWISGRTDALCCMFYLGALLLAVSGNSWRYKALSIVCFAFAMLSKEMAIGTAVVIASIALLWPEKVGGSQKSNVLSRILFALRFSAPWIIATIIYFIVRYFALGTMTGGYTGGLGAGQAAQAIQRWIDPDVIYRLLFPLSTYIYPQHTIYRTLLAIGYGIVGLITCVRLLTGELSKRWFAFLLLLTFTTVVPLYQLWGLGMFLQGARYYFFLTIPISLFCSILVFQPSRNPNSFLGNVLSARLSVISAVALLLLVATFSRIAYATTSLWMHAGREVRQFKNACVNLADQIPDGKYAVVLSAPNDHGGAHMILNAPTFFMMLQPPFTKSVHSEKFLSFEPPVFGGSETINSERFKSVLEDPRTARVVRWSTTYRALAPLLLNPRAGSAPSIDLPISTNTEPNWQSYTDGHARVSSQNGIARLDNTISGDGLFFPKLNCNPLEYDFLEFQIKYEDSAVPPVIKARWNIDKPAGSDANTIAIQQLEDLSQPEFKTIRVRLSNCLHWFTTGPVKNLALELFPAKQIEISELKLVPRSALAPEITVPGSASQFGIYTINPKTPLAVSGGPQNDIILTQIQSSKPDYFFENTINDTATGSSIILPPGKSTITTADLGLPKAGLYQIRARRINPADVRSTEWSEPITVHFL
jgi:hypothetical protein